MTQSSMEKSGMFCFIVGLLVTIFGVGGIEQSLDNSGLLLGALVSTVGLMIMGCGAMMIQNAEAYK